MDSDATLRKEVETPTPADQSSTADWLRAHALGLSCCVMGVLAFVITTGVHLGTGGAFFSDLPEPWLTVPMLVVTTCLGVASIVRGESSLRFLAVGVSFSATAVVLGWFVAAAIIVILAVVAIQVLSETL